MSMLRWSLRSRPWISRTQSCSLLEASVCGTILNRPLPSDTPSPTTESSLRPGERHRYIKTSPSAPLSLLRLSVRSPRPPFHKALDLAILNTTGILTATDANATFTYLERLSDSVRKDLIRSKPFKYMFEGPYIKRPEHAAPILARFFIKLPRLRDPHLKDLAECRSMIPLPSEGQASSLESHLEFKSNWKFFNGEGLFKLSLSTRHLTKALPEFTDKGDRRNDWDRNHPFWNDKVLRLSSDDYDPIFQLHYMIYRSVKEMDPGPESNFMYDVAIATFELAESRADCPNVQNAKARWYSHQQVSPPGYGAENATLMRQSDSYVTLHDYKRTKSNPLLRMPTSFYHKVYIALGSNMGDKISNIEEACQELARKGLKVTRTSFLYQSDPMYYSNQPDFLNAVCEVETRHDPAKTLYNLKGIEKNFGRIKTIDNGPRPIDLDILLYDNQIYEQPDLSIPHKKMMEREFVLRPLADIIPKASSPTSDPLIPFQDSLKTLDTSCRPLTPLKTHGHPISLTENKSQKRLASLMMIVNATPDSFSDGGVHNYQNASSVASSLRDALGERNEVTLLDIGGQSTRPHAPEISPFEEISRVIPLIQKLRSDRAFDKVPISVDTYRASVAEKAINSGADIINDVSAGQLDLDMLPTIAKMGCTCILMHMRGNPETMNKLTQYDEGVIKGVAKELRLRVAEAERAGIRRWRIILDPGIGFAKTHDQNLTLLRDFEELRKSEGLEGFPWVVGASRKKFIGTVTDQPIANERQWGTAACITAAIQGGADIVRVHDVREMTQVVKMANAIYRT